MRRAEREAILRDCVLAVEAAQAIPARDLKALLAEKGDNEPSCAEREMLLAMQEVHKLDMEMIEASGYRESLSAWKARRVPTTAETIGAHEAAVRKE